MKSEESSQFSLTFNSHTLTVITPDISTKINVFATKEKIIQLVM